MREIFWYFLKLGWLAFGGPVGQIGLMHLECVERRRWLDEEEFVRVLKLPDVRERFASLGTDIHGTTPEEFAAQIRSDTAKFGKVIKAANIKVE